ncbi:pectinesterase inhibitor 28-like [Aristolochia californica]|uniref:pectinesterase inhibitor 28-like n=1 Tax=Aristolochia californica TaxID=171875 RepID=UPI0035DB0808
MAASALHGRRFFFTLKQAFVLLTVLLLFRLSSGASTVNDVILEVCNYTTRHYDLCVSALSSDPNSLTADRHALAGIALDLSLLNASDSVLFIAKLASEAKNEKHHGVFKTCLDFYNQTVVLHIIKAEENFHVQDYDNTIGELSYCIGYSQMCGEELKKLPFPGETPLQGRTEVQINLCEITQILMTLLRYY